MKSFVKKVAALAVAFSMASSTLANAQGRNGVHDYFCSGDIAHRLAHRT